MQKSYKDLNIQFLPDNIVQDLNLQAHDSLVSQINNLSESLSAEILSIVGNNLL